MEYTTLGKNCVVVAGSVVTNGIQKSLIDKLIKIFTI